MDKRIKYIIALTVIVLFTCLGVGLKINLCGALFGGDCSIYPIYEKMIGLLATALICFIVALVLSIVVMKRHEKMLDIAELIAVFAGAVFSLAAICVYYDTVTIWAPLMMGIAMTLAFETAAFLLIDLIA